MLIPLGPEILNELTGNLSGLGNESQRLPNLGLGEIFGRTTVVVCGLQVRAKQIAVLRVSIWTNCGLGRSAYIPFTSHISSRILVFSCLGACCEGIKLGAEYRDVSSNEPANEGLGGLKNGSPFPYIGIQIVQSGSEN